MEKWIYALNSASELKKAVSVGMDGCDEQLADIMVALEACVNEVNEFFHKDNDEFYEFANLIDGEADLVRVNDPLIRDMMFQSPRALVEGRLDDFFDLCDKYRIWVSPN